MSDQNAGGSDELVMELGLNIMGMEAGPLFTSLVSDAGAVSS